ncbi:MAG: hypothetical protein V3U88_08490 [Methylococcales bacterium]
MKTLMTIVVLGLFISGNAFAAGSKIKGSTITNKANITSSQNIAFAMGKAKAEANQGSVKIKGSKIKNSTITNEANIKSSQNIAFAMGKAKAIANQGSVEIQ